MKRFFGKKRKRTPNPLQQPIPPDKPGEVATDSSGLRADQDDDISGRNHRCYVIDLPSLIAEKDSVSTGASSQIAIQDGASEFRVSSLGIDDTGSGHELASERFSPLRSG